MDINCLPVMATESGNKAPELLLLAAVSDDDEDDFVVPLAELAVVEPTMQPLLPHVAVTFDCGV